MHQVSACIPLYKRESCLRERLYDGERPIAPSSNRNRNTMGYARHRVTYYRRGDIGACLRSTKRAPPPPPSFSKCVVSELPRGTAMHHQGWELPRSPRRPPNGVFFLCIYGVRCCPSAGPSGLALRLLCCNGGGKGGHFSMGRRGVLELRDL